MPLGFAGILFWLSVGGQAQETEKVGPREEFSVLHLVPPKPLYRSPARISSNNLLQALFGFLPLESARTLEEWRLDVGVTEDISSGSLDVVTDEYFFHYDATLFETNIELRLGLPAGFEARLGLDISELFQGDDKIILERNPGLFLVEPGERGFGTGDLKLSLKKSIWTFQGQESSGGIGLVAGIKIPVPTDQEDLLTSSGVDFAASVLYTHEVGPFSFHLNLGLILAGSARVFGEDVETRPALTFGAAVAYQFAEWGLALIQIQGNQSVFSGSADSVSILDDWVATVHLGGRFRIGSYFLEPSIGTGLGDRSSGFVATVGFVVPFGGAR